MEQEGEAGNGSRQRLDRLFCRICGGPVSRIYMIREVMFGTGETFEYGECDDCGTLQILAMPGDMSAYYPEGYYSFTASSGRNNMLRRAVKKNVLRLGVLAPRSAVGRFVRRALPSWLFRIPKLNSKTRILDVGSGQGALLHQLASWGFTSLEGVDPFIETDVENAFFRIKKAELAEINGNYDVITMHHSLEHVADPKTSLREARRLLAAGGTLIVRIPVKGGYFWEHYDQNWVQIDPPRHFYLFTERGFIEVAREQGLQLCELFYDATDFAFWGSELAKRGLSMQDDSEITPEERSDYSARIQRLNELGESDQACFVLQQSVETRHSVSRGDGRKQPVRKEK